MNLNQNPLYLEDLSNIAKLNLPFEKLKNKNIFISGASGLIGSFLIDAIMMLNKEKELNCHIYAIGRNKEKLENRFSEYVGKALFTTLIQDVNVDFAPVDAKSDYVLHLASNTHPLAYSNDPIGTITTNILGTYNLLTFAACHKCERFAFTSSVEIYGENKGDTDKFKEDYLGYINSNTLRAGYPESKRAGEALCQAFIKQKDMNIVIPRLSRSYGPTLLQSDSKAISQFIKKGIAKEDIVLKSSGKQFYSYSYVADSVSGILYCLLLGENGQAYNIADDKSDISLRNLAQLIADFVGTKVVFEIPDANESAGYSKATKAVLDSSKLQKLGWKAQYSISEGIKRTIKILR